jgi:hypothetical protein
MFPYAFVFFRNMWLWLWLLFSHFFVFFVFLLMCVPVGVRAILVHLSLVIVVHFFFFFFFFFVSFGTRSSILWLISLPSLLLPATTRTGEEGVEVDCSLFTFESDPTQVLWQAPGLHTALRFHGENGSTLERVHTHTQDDGPSTHTLPHAHSGSAVYNEEDLSPTHTHTAAEGQVHTVDIRDAYSAYDLDELDDEEEQAEAKHIDPEGQAGSAGCAMDGAVKHTRTSGEGLSELDQLLEVSWEDDLRRRSGASRRGNIEQWAVMEGVDVSNFEELVPNMALEVRG